VNRLCCVIYVYSFCIWYGVGDYADSVYYMENVWSE